MNYVSLNKVVVQIYNHVYYRSKLRDKAYFPWLKRESIQMSGTINNNKKRVFLFFKEFSLKSKFRLMIHIRSG